MFQQWCCSGSLHSRFIWSSLEIIHPPSKRKGNLLKNIRLVFRISDIYIWNYIPHNLAAFYAVSMKFEGGTWWVLMLVKSLIYHKGSNIILRIHFSPWAILFIFLIGAGPRFLFSKGSAYLMIISFFQRNWTLMILIFVPSSLLWFFLESLIQYFLHQVLVTFWYVASMLYQSLLSFSSYALQGTLTMLSCLYGEIWWSW